MVKVLHPKQPQNIKSINILLGVIFISQGVLNLSEIEKTFDLVLGIIQVLLGVVYIFLAQSLVKSNSPLTPKIILDDKAIRLKKGLFSGTMTFKIEDIKNIQLKPEEVTVTTKESEHSYSLNYESLNKQEIIEDINSYANDQNIPVQHIGYRNVKS